MAGRGSLLTLRAPLWVSQLFAGSSGCTREALAAHPGVGSAKMWWAPRGRGLLPVPQNGSFGDVLTHPELCSELPWERSCTSQMLVGRGQSLGSAVSSATWQELKPISASTSPSAKWVQE